MKTKTINLYQFDELSDKAKEKARDWWRNLESQNFGSGGDLNEPFETAAKLLGIEFKRHEVGLMGGGKRSEPNIWWQLHVQGSGASFEGTYSYAKGSAKAVRAEFGTDTVLWAIADSLTEFQKRHGYRVNATIEADSRYHSLLVEAYKNGAGVDEKTLTSILEDFATWIYKRIDEEYTWRMSDENVDDAIRTNEHTFTDDGEFESE